MQRQDISMFSRTRVKGAFGDNFYFVHKTICYGYSSEALTEALLMGTHNICFNGEIEKIIPELSSNTPILDVKSK